MLRDDLLLRTKLAPPRLRKRMLHRPALTTRLREALDYRVTLVQAGTGYGKSTALAALAEGEAPDLLAWYSVSEADIEPQRFLSYLVAAFRLRLPNLSESPVAVLQELSNSGAEGGWYPAVDALVNALSEVLSGPALLVVDDYHFVASTPQVNALVEHFLTYMPPDLHVVVSARYPLSSPKLSAWRARGEVLDISREDLMFGTSEVEALFRDTYEMQLAPEDVAALVHKTEGWPIALQLVWQGLRHSPAPAARSAADLLAAPSRSAPMSLSALFDYLAHDVLDRQPAEIAAFLQETAVLRELTPAACNAVTGSADSATLLSRLHELDLFVVSLGEHHFRYHHLFHDFLREQAQRDTGAERARHRRAAEYFRAASDFEEAIYHYLAAEDYLEAATAIAAASEVALRAGRVDTVALWIDAVPPDVLAEQPRLQTYLGDVYRLRSRFEEALAWYRQAEATWRARGDPAGISRALRGQALVYLDTVRPVEAENLLQEALRLTEGTADQQARARMLELLAENKLNMGKPDEAERLRAAAGSLRADSGDEDLVSVRVKLRTGRLDEAQHILEVWMEAERRAAEQGQSHPPRGHRETVLILSLIHSFRGGGERAFALAEAGIALSAQLDSPFMTAVAHVRLGHAWQLRHSLPGAPGPQTDYAHARDEAIRCYQAAIALGDRLAVRRIRAEAMWGLTRAYGFSGDLESARRAAAEGMEVGRWAGDLWIGALTELMLGASYVLAGRTPEAVEILTQLLVAFRECGDSLGRTATRLWLSLAYAALGQSEHFAASVDDLLSLCETHAYGWLFTAPTLLGPPDPHCLVPVLIEARARRRRPVYAMRLLAEMGLPDIQHHPGYQLRVQTLGTFRVWRGATEMEAREWRRDKARQLFQLLLTQPGRPLQREEITERLWPALSPEAANRDFKVALNALNKALEPARAPDAASAFIARDGATYQVRPEADLWIDTAEFTRAAEAGLARLEANDAEGGIALLQAALQLYTGEFLPEALYEDWVSEARERLLALYLRAADRLSSALIERGRYDEGLAVSQAILARDPCWERAYRLMMVAYARQGNRPQAARAYQRCVSVLREELDVEPSPATARLYEKITQAEEISEAV